jgi:thymidine kinase
MFSGKTTALLDRLHEADATGRRVLAVKPARDDRYGSDRIASHTGQSCTATPIGRPQEILKAAAGANVVGIDEVHFWNTDIVPVCAALKSRGCRVIAAGVDLDHRGQPFAAAAGLERIADDVQRLTAICARCGAVAVYTQRMIASDEPIVVGGAGDYEPRCAACFEPMA